MRDSVKTIGRIIDKSSISIIGSVDQEGFPNTKAMFKPRKRVGIKEIYFSTNTSSMRVSQFKEDPKSCLYFFDRRFFRGVMLRGTMDVLTDIEIKKEIWQEGDEMYYPDGITDPDYCVLKFTAQDGRYYTNFKSEDFLID